MHASLGETIDYTAGSREDPRGSGRDRLDAARGHPGMLVPRIMRFAFYLYSTCILPAFYMHSTCILHAFYMHSTCILHVSYPLSSRLSLSRLLDAFWCLLAAPRGSSLLLEVPSGYLHVGIVKIVLVL